MEPVFRRSGFTPPKSPLHAAFTGLFSVRRLYRGRGRRSTHPFAIDLFALEGSPVCSATRGLVVLAENGWRPGEWFSTSSVRGGNTVIVFDPDGRRFLRYAHLDSATAVTGLFVEASDVIGTVGHTGFNADRKGHGRHLHFEINEYDRGTVRAISRENLKLLLGPAPR